MWNAVTHAFNKILDSDPDLAVAVAAITILTEVIKVSKGTRTQFFAMNTRKEQIAEHGTVRVRWCACVRACD